MKIVTFVHIDTDSITVRRNDAEVGKILSSMQVGKIGKTVKMLGISVFAGLLLGVGAVASVKLQTKEEENINKSQIIGIVLLGIVMAVMGFQFYNNSVFRVRYKYDNKWQESADISSSVINQSGFKIRKYEPQKMDFMVRFQDGFNFEIMNNQGDQEFTTKDPSYRSSVSAEEYIGSFVPILNKAVIRVEYDKTMMRNKDDIVILAAVMTYLKDKMRVINLVGGLNLLGVVIPAYIIVKQWPSLEKQVDERVKDDHLEKVISLLKK